MTKQKLTNANYTNHFKIDFNLQNVITYHNKFYLNFEKNIKHLQQIEFVKKFVKADTYWCDFPVGSARLFENIPVGTKCGADISPSFLEYVSSLGIKAISADLLNNPFRDEFDLITCMHTLFAFDDPFKIIKGHINALKSGGVLVFDITNQHHIQFLTSKNISYQYFKGMTRESISELAVASEANVIDILNHDYWDNILFSNYRKSNNIIIRNLYSIYWRFLNRQYRKTKIPLINRSYNRPEHLYLKYLVALQKL